MQSRVGRNDALSPGFLSSRSVGKERQTGSNPLSVTADTHTGKIFTTTRTPVRYRFAVVGPTRVCCHSTGREPDLLFCLCLHRRRKSDHRGGRKADKMNRGRFEYYFRYITVTDLKRDKRDKRLILRKVLLTRLAFPYPPPSLILPPPPRQQYQCRLLLSKAKMPMKKVSPLSIAMNSNW
jgi:hypothetical protein